MSHVGFCVDCAFLEDGKCHLNPPQPLPIPSDEIIINSVVSLKGHTEVVVDYPTIPDTNNAWCNGWQAKT